MTSLEIYELLERYACGRYDPDNPGTRVYRENQTIITIDSSLGDVFFLLEGSVKVQSFSTDGDNTVIATLFAPQILGLTELLLGKDGYGASVITRQPCSIVKVPAVEFRTMLSEYPDAYRLLAPYLAALATQNMNASESRIILNGRERLGLYLVSACHNQKFPYFLRETREQIAQNTHNNLRTLYRYLDDFTDRGLISRQGARIYLTQLQYQLLKDEYDSLL